MTKKIMWMSVLVIGLSVMSQSSVAYIGPGAGLAMMGSLIGVVVALLLAVVGVIVLPIRMMMKKRSQKKEAATARPTGDVADDSNKDRT